ncbi:MAG: glycosyltransferase family 2 protein [Akkermansiaceae bacterium]|nr:glycosyltransferase family 2 protein [Akkermansiaceae bacterium]
MTAPNATFWIVMPVHNRREITLGCLEHLRTLGVLDWARLVVVDDGSTDGTAEAVQSAFADTTVLRGDGGLWWGGAIRLGMKHAMDHGAAAIFWLNDDCLPEPGSLETIRDLALERKAIVTAQTRTDLGIRNGGRTKTRFGLRHQTCPSGGVLPCDFTSGNCVCIPAEIFNRIGPPRADWVPHHFADHDYGLLAREAGFRCFVSGDAICDDACRHVPSPMAQVYASWLLGDRPLREIWRDARRPKSPLYLRARLAHFPRYWGIWGYFLALAPFAKLAAVTAIRSIVPVCILRRIFGHRSVAWKMQSLYGTEKTAAEAKSS